MKERCRYLLIFLLVLAFLCPTLLAPKLVVAADSDVLEAHFLDVGQGQATLFRKGDQVILIDGGGQGSSRFVVAYLKAQGISRVDLMVATHFDEDHIAGLIGVLNVFPVSRVLMGIDPTGTRVSDSFMNCVAALNTTTPQIGDEFKVGDMRLEIKGPSAYHNEIHNDDSIIMRLSFGNTSFLVGGDTTADGEQQLLDQDLTADVMLANHHGSKGSNSCTWLEAVNPQHIVISCGKNNPYGHPSDTVLERISRTKASLHRTDESGTIVFLSDGETVWPTSGVAQGFRSEVEAADEELRDYVLNTNTKKFHYPTCRSVGQMKEKNKRKLRSIREEILAQGYSPCGHCKP